MSQNTARGFDKDDLYWSSHVRGIDKGRVMLPQEWRPDNSPNEFVLLFWPPPTCQYLLALTPEHWSEIRKKLQAAPPTDEEEAEIERQICARISRTTLDKYGRLLLPEDTGRILEVTDKVTLVGRFNKFEIWNPAKRPNLIDPQPTNPLNPELVKKIRAKIGI